MGLWDWVWNTLTGQSASAPCEPSPRVRRESGNSSTATATFDSYPTPSPADPAPQTGPETPNDTDVWWAPLGVMQTVPLPVSVPSLSTEARALEQRLISHFDGHDLVLPPMPKAADKVLKRLRDSKSGAPQIAHDLAEDPVIAGGVLRMSNSVLYRGAEKVASLPAAVTRLGTNALRTLMMHQSLRAALFQFRGDMKEFAELVWEGSLASGLVMRDLARFVRMDEEEAFLIGLLHDIGNVIVLRLAHEQEKLTHSPIDLPTFEYLCHETHQEFGELIANGWNLAPKLQSLIADHHSDPADDDPLRKERWTIMASDMICQMLGYAPAAQYDLLNTRAFQELQLNHRVEVHEWLAQLPQRIAETILEM